MKVIKFTDGHGILWEAFVCYGWPAWPSAQMRHIAIGEIPVAARRNGHWPVDAKAAHYMQAMGVTAIYYLAENRSGTPAGVVGCALDRVAGFDGPVGELGARLCIPRESWCVWGPKGPYYLAPPALWTPQDWPEPDWRKDVELLPGDPRDTEVPMDREWLTPEKARALFGEAKKETK